MCSWYNFKDAFEKYWKFIDPKILKFTLKLIYNWGCYHLYRYLLVYEIAKQIKPVFNVTLVNKTSLIRIDKRQIFLIFTLFTVSHTVIYGIYYIRQYHGCKNKFLFFCFCFILIFVYIFLFDISKKNILLFYLKNNIYIYFLLCVNIKNHRWDGSLT